MGGKRIKWVGRPGAGIEGTISLQSNKFQPINEIVWKKIVLLLLLFP